MIWLGGAVMLSLIAMLVWTVVPRRRKISLDADTCRTLSDDEIEHWLTCAKPVPDCATCANIAEMRRHT